jgi:hypothetical protein
VPFGQLNILTNLESLAIWVSDLEKESLLKLKELPKLSFLRIRATLSSLTVGIVEQTINDGKPIRCQVIVSVG